MSDFVLSTPAGDAVRDNYRRQGIRTAIAELERIICFDALADDDGRCVHHGGKCYDIRQLIKRLESK